VGAPYSRDDFCSSQVNVREGRRTALLGTDSVATSDAIGIQSLWGLRTSMRGVSSTVDIEMSIAAAIFAARYWLGLQVELVLVYVHSWMLEFAGLFPGR
jgi:hypothetical protein